MPVAFNCEAWDTLLLSYNEDKKGYLETASIKKKVV